MMSSAVHPIRDEALGNTSYLVAIGEATAIIVDPRRDVDEYLALADRLGVRIVGVLETHLHADFISGAREIADATGADIYAAADARLSFAHTPLRPDTRLTISDTLIEVVSTPGHTPEHVAYIVTTSGERAVFSGGSLIVGGAARTDLTGPERSEELARAQFASLRHLAELPNETLLYPTHGAGSFCSTGPARSAASTIGAECGANPLLAIDDEDAFVKRLVAGFGSYPRYFAFLRETNRIGAPLLRTIPPVRQIDAAVAKDAVERGAWLIDGRAVNDWARAHPHGAVSIEIRPAFASWLGWVVPFGAPVVLVLEPEQASEASRLAHRIGYDRIEGWTTLEAWREAGLPVATIETLTPQQAAERAEAGTILLDVRQQSEFAQSHLPGALHFELGDIIAGEAPEATDVITYCGHGERSATAASLLARRGIHAANLSGGASAWRRAALPIER